MAKRDCSELAVTLTQIAYNLAESENVKSFDDVVAGVKKILPQVQREELVQAIEAYERQGRQTDIRQTLSKLAQIKLEALVEADLRQKIQGRVARLREQIEKRGGKAPTRLLNKTIEALRQANADLAEREAALARAMEIERQIESGTIPKTPAKKQGPVTQEKARSQTASQQAASMRAEQRTIEQTRQRIEELQKQIAAEDYSQAPSKGRREPSPAVQELRSIAGRLRREIGVRRQIEELRQQLETGNIPEPAPRVQQMDSKMRDLMIERDMLRRKARAYLNEMKPKSFFTKYVRSPFRLLGSIITTGEFSAILNQGGFAALSRPILTAKALPAGFKAFLSEKGAGEVIYDRENRRNFLLYERAKLYISDELGAVSQREEAVLSKLLDKVPVIAGFQRFHMEFLNQLRMDMFDALTDTLTANGEPTLDEVRAIANFVNASTGRGSVGALEPSARILADFAFAPRYYASRIQMLTGQPIWGVKSSGRVKKAIAIQYARYATGYAVVAFGMALAGADIEKDPRSTDFGQFRFGNTRIDLLSGLRQFTVFAARVLWGSTKTGSGAIVPLRGEDKPFASRETADVIFQFGRSKLSPGLSVLTDLVTQKDFLGDDVTVSSLAKHFAGPITYRDIYDVMRSDLNLPKKTALSILAMSGGMMTSYTRDVPEEASRLLQIRRNLSTKGDRRTPQEQAQYNRLRKFESQYRPLREQLKQAQESENETSASQIRRRMQRLARRYDDVN